MSITKETGLVREPSIGDFKYLGHQALIDLYDFIDAEIEELTEYYYELDDLEPLDIFARNQMQLQVKCDVGLLHTLLGVIDDALNQHKENEQEIRKTTKE